MINIYLDPNILQIGAFQLAWHGIFSALALAAGLWLGTRRGEQAGAPSDALNSIAIWGVVGAVIGARLFFVIDHLPEFVQNPLRAIAIWEGGIAVYGAFIGGVVGGIFAARRAGLRIWPLLDAAAPAIILGQAIGRIGCLINGDAWGAPTGGDWGVVYWHPSALIPPTLHGVPTHPYPLYEMIACGALLAMLWLIERRKPRTGTVFLVAAIGYAVMRFSLSFVRQEAVVLWGLQQAQVIALITGLIALIFLLLRLRNESPSARTAISG